MVREKRTLIFLPLEQYEKLERLAAAEDRDPWQHARWLLRRAIDAAPEPGEAMGDAKRNAAEGVR